MAGFLAAERLADFLAGGFFREDDFFDEVDFFGAAFLLAPLFFEATAGFAFARDAAGFGFCRVIADFADLTAGLALAVTLLTALATFTTAFAGFDFETASTAGELAGSGVTADAGAGDED